MKKVTLCLSFFLILHSAYSQGDWKWSSQMESAGDLYPSSNIVMSIQVDDQNNTYHCGQYDSQSLTIQGTTIPNSGNWDAFICKFDRVGNLVWLKRMHSPNRDEAAAMAIVGGHIYVAGSYKDRIVFSATDTLNHDNNYDAYLAKYDLNGNFIAANQIFYGSSIERIKDMAFDPYRGELVLTGFFKTSISYTDNNSQIQSVSTEAGGKDMFFAQSDLDGKITGFRSAHTLQSNNGTVFKDINISPDSSYYLTGDLFDRLIFSASDDTIFGEVESKVLIVKLSKTFDLEWARIGGGAVDDHANSAASDRAGNVYIAGKIQGDVTFDSTEILKSSTVPDIGGTDLFLAKYNTNGRLLWIKRKGGQGIDDAFGIDVFQNLVQFCGNYADTLIINNDTLTSSGISDINTGFAIFDLDGNEIGAQGIGGIGEDVGRSISFDKNGKTVLAGYFTSPTVQIGDDTHTNTSNMVTGFRDGFVASYNYPFSTSLIQTKEIACSGDSTAEVVGNAYFGVAPYTYEWSSNVTDFVDSVAFYLPKGTYTLTVTDSRDSVTINEIMVGEPSLIQVELDSTDLTCYQSADGTITTNVSGGVGAYTYAWVGASGYNPTAKNQSGLGAGWFYVSVTDGNSCQAIDSIEVLQPSKITTTALVTPENPGLSDGAIDVTVTGGLSPYIHSWEYEGSPFPGSSNLLSGLEEGLFTAFIKDANLCEYDTNIVVPGVALRVVLLNKDISCVGMIDGELHASIASGQDPAETYTFEFFNAAKTSIATGTDSILTALTPGWYYVTLTEDGTSETSSDSVEIIEPDSIKISFEPTNALCNGHSTAIGTIITGGTPEFIFSWSNGASSQSLVEIPAGKYILTVTDENLCTAIDSVQTTEPEMIDINIVETNSIACFGAINGQLEANVNGGITPYNYLWNDNGRQTTYFAKVLNAGIFEVQVTDSNNCLQAKTYKLSEPPILELNSIDTANVSCKTSADGSIKVIMQGGTAPYAYTWSHDIANDSSSATGLFAASFPYSVSVSDANGCGDSVYSHKVKAPAVALSVSENSEAHVNNLCSDATNGSFTINASGGWGNYEYSINLIDWNSVPVYNNLAAREYTVSIKDAEGCIEAIDINIVAPPKLFLASVQVLGNSIIGGGTGGVAPYSYSIDLQNWQNSGLFTGLLSGDYQVYLTDANNCGPITSDMLSLGSSSIRPDAVKDNVILKVYPNPSSGKFNLEFGEFSSHELDLEVYTLTGLRVHRETLLSVSSQNKLFEIDLTNQNKGIYFLKVNGSLQNYKLIIE